MNTSGIYLCGSEVFWVLVHSNSFFSHTFNHNSNRIKQRTRNTLRSIYSSSVKSYSSLNLWHMAKWAVKYGLALNNYTNSSSWVWIFRNLQYMIKGLLLLCYNGRTNFFKKKYAFNYSICARSRPGQYGDRLLKTSFKATRDNPFKIFAQMVNHSKPEDAFVSALPCLPQRAANHRAGAGQELSSG